MAAASFHDDDISTMTGETPVADNVVYLNFSRTTSLSEPHCAYVADRPEVRKMPILSLCIVLALLATGGPRSLCVYVS